MRTHCCHSHKINSNNTHNPHPLSTVHLNPPTHLFLAANTPWRLAIAFLAFLAFCKTALWHCGPEMKKYTAKKSQLIIHCPIRSGVSGCASEQMSMLSGVREQSKQGRASQRVTGMRKQTNGGVSSPVLLSGFLLILDHSAFCKTALRSENCFLIWPSPDAGNIWPFAYCNSSFWS